MKLYLWNRIICNYMPLYYLAQWVVHPNIGHSFMVCGHCMLRKLERLCLSVSLKQFRRYNNNLKGKILLLLQSERDLDLSKSGVFRPVTALGD